MNKDNHNGEKGAVLVVVALCLVLFLGITAFTVDIGYLQYQKRQLQNTADAAALAGAAEYVVGDSSLGNITEVVENYVQLNGVDVQEVENVTLSQKFGSAQNNAVTVDLKGNRGIFFAKIFGIYNADIGVTATAIASPVSGMQQGLLPFYFPEEYVSTIEYKKIYDKFNDDNPFTSGNWGTTSFFENGQNVINDWIKDGYDGEVVSAGDKINIKPGAGLNSIKNILSNLENGIYAIPVISNIAGPGASQKGDVVGFVGVEVIDTGGKGSNLYIEVQFLEMIAIGEMNPPEELTNYKLQALRLIE